MNKLKSVLSYFQVILIRLFLTKSESEISGYDGKESKGNLVCLTLMNDPFYLRLYSLFHLSLAKAGFAKRLLFVNVDTALERQARIERLLQKDISTRIFMKPYTNIGELWSSCLLEETQIYSKKAIDEAAEILSKIKTKRDLLEFRYGEIKMGDLIYDTYLRLKPSLTINLKDPFLIKVVLNALSIYDLAFKKLSKDKVEALVTPYCCGYIHWGIWSRVALSKKIPVIIVGNANQFIKILREDFPIHAKDYDLYADFKSIQPTQEILSSIEATLQKRLSGEVVDQAIYYMKENPFASAPKPIGESYDQISDSIVFMLHSFTDCPHVYRSMLFEDFFEWIIQSLEFCKNNNIKATVKVHPADSLKQRVVSEIRERFSEVYFIPFNVNNNEVLSCNIKGAVTIHGTVAHEFPFLKVPVVCAGDNPHAVFGFSKICNSKEEYFSSLKMLSEGGIGIGNKDDILKFYFCHNEAMFPGRISPELSSLAWSYFSKPSKEAIPVDSSKFDYLLHETARAVKECLHDL